MNPPDIVDCFFCGQTGPLGSIAICRPSPEIPYPRICLRCVLILDQVASVITATLAYKIALDRQEVSHDP